jgi:hypothetical protein
VLIPREVRLADDGTTYHKESPAGESGTTIAQGDRWHQLEANAYLAEKLPHHNGKS